MAFVWLYNTYFFRYDQVAQIAKPKVPLGAPKYGCAEGLEVDKD